ncbi:MAG: ABC transporter permease subunit [Alphaproteobacteria bacterium]
MILAVVPVLIIILFSIPILTVLTNLLRTDQGTLLHLTHTVLADYIINSIVLLIGVIGGSYVVGVGAAWLVVSFRFPGVRIFEWALVLPLAVPAYIMAYAYANFFQSAGVVQTMLRDATGWAVQDYWFPDIRSLGGAILIFTVALYPYVYLIARAAFLDQSASALEVARTLSRTPWRSFFRIALPLARPALVAGLALVAMETLADYGVVSYFGIPTLTVGVYRAWFSMRGIILRRPRLFLLPFYSRMYLFLGTLGSWSPPVS